MFAFMTPSYFKVPKEAILSSTHYFVMKFAKKRWPQQIAFDHSSDIDFKNFMKICKKYISEKYSLLVNDLTLPSDNSLRFRKNPLKKMF